MRWRRSLSTAAPNSCPSSLRACASSFAGSRLSVWISKVSSTGRSGSSRTRSVKRQAHGMRDLAQQRDRDIALPGLELRQIALGHLGIARQDLARHAAPGARLADALAERAQIGGLAILGRAPVLACRFVSHRHAVLSPPPARLRAMRAYVL